MQIHSSGPHFLDDLEEQAKLTRQVRQKMLSAPCFNPNSMLHQEAEFFSLPEKLHLHIFSKLSLAEKLTAQLVCKAWALTMRKLSLLDILTEFQLTFGKERLEAILQDEHSSRHSLSSPDATLELIVRNQKKRLTFLLQENVQHFPLSLSFDQVLTIEQWIKDYNLLLMCQGQSHVVDHVAQQAIQHIAQHTFDIAPYAKQLRGLLAKETFDSVCHLDLSHRHLTELPAEIKYFSNLSTLALDDNQISFFPLEMAELPELIEICCERNSIHSIPSAIFQLTRLLALSFAGNQLQMLPPEIAHFVELESLDLGDNQLTSLPPQLTLLAQLDILDIRNNQLHTLPPGISQLSNLAILIAIGNPFVELPRECLQLKSLRRLILSPPSLQHPFMQSSWDVIQALKEQNVAIYHF